MEMRVLSESRRKFTREFKVAAVCWRAEALARNARLQAAQDHSGNEAARVAGWTTDGSTCVMREEQLAVPAPATSHADQRFLCSTFARVLGE